MWFVLSAETEERKMNLNKIHLCEYSTKFSYCDATENYFDALNDATWVERSLEELDQIAENSSSTKTLNIPLETARNAPHHIFECKTFLLLKIMALELGEIKCI